MPLQRAGGGTQQHIVGGAAQGSGAHLHFGETQRVGPGDMLATAQGPFQAGVWFRRGEAELEQIYGDVASGSGQFERVTWLVADGL